MPDPSRRAVVTGIGVVAPNGIGTADWWQATLAGQTGIGPIARFDASGYPVRLAGEVKGFEAEDWIERRLIVQTDHWTHMALAA
ncbi:MAG: ketosynthase chain-length factor, partial [Thermoleophilaceae bacterium]|nr:ketosynthase chain-length factor [Thermoleophilaceae bacterium]